MLTKSLLQNLREERNKISIHMANNLFLDVSAGFPGSMHDFRVLRNSSLYQRITNNELLLGPTVRVAGRDIRPILLGDSAYPLSTWLLKLYHEGTTDSEEINFNKELSHARVSVESAFGILK